MEIFHRILATAVEGGASDIHIKVGGPIIFRINRKLVPIEAPLPTTEWMESILKGVLPNHARKLLDAEMGCDFSYMAPGVGRFRTNVFLQRGQHAMALRYVKSQVPAFEALGLLPICRKIAESPRGIVLVAGSTGSGKSTTLAAMIEHINSNFRKHIITLEDPIEYSYEDNQSVIEQREIGLDCESFQQGMKHALRQDPDIILVGEMRDAVSFQTAMGAADTGHLVMSTVHTTNASLAISRVLDFFKADDREQVRRQLAGTLQAVLCQRMVTTIDGSVTPAQEVLLNTPTVRKLLEENRLDTLPAAIETGSEDGMVNFNQALYKLVQDGKVSQKEALAKATNARALEMNFQGIFLSEGKRILG
ncbi:MAG: PilT/PilU family type 4a pilus ATPase [Opitutaceae bacterium]|nr:PilT/PilU family type 4a pilus ATPase [Verrucomicrobiales bacterium]